MQSIRRHYPHLRFAVWLASIMVALGATAAAQEGGRAGEEERGFSFETVVEQAREVAGGDFERKVLDLSAPFADLDYGDYNAIGFRQERRLWHNEDRGFEIDLLPPGMLYEDRVGISLVRDGTDSPIAFDPSVFRFDPERFPFPDGAAPADESPDLTYSGFRVFYPIDRQDRLEEFMVFHGASYFRAVARDQLYGLWARGLALGTGSAEGEEFPVFRHLWIWEPEEGATSLRIHALLDSPSVSGAFEFIVHPGAETVMDVRVVLFPRRDLPTVGIAPLTSMYYFGPANRRFVDDFRDAVHDSSGLQMVTGGGLRLWRPLENPTTLQISSFGDNDPQGFGLAQRERDFGHFEDARARYERRPSSWVEPQDGWGEGAVVLVEIPTPNEFHDNIVTFWRPSEPLAGGGEYRFQYRLFWSDQPPDLPALARVAATRGGAAINNPGQRTFVVDFDLGEVPFEGLEPRATASAGTIRSLSLFRVPRDGHARAAIRFDPEGAELSELNLVLVDAQGAPASETWLTRWTHDD